MSRTDPLVSVVVPCYNHENYVQECIQSIIDQDYINIELIIIDDGSKDGSVDKIKEMLNICKKRFKHFEFRSRQNKGLCATLNEAIIWCSGEYFSPIASDDKMLKNKISLQIQFMEKHTSFPACGGKIIKIYDDGRMVKSSNFIKFKKLGFKDFILHKKSIPAPTLLYRFSDLRSIGGYPEDISVEDWFMLLKLTETGKSLAVLPDLLCFYRIHVNNFSKNYIKVYESHLKILKNYKNSEYFDEAIRKVNYIYYTNKFRVESSGLFNYFREISKLGLLLSIKGLCGFIYTFIFYRK